MPACILRPQTQQASRPSQVRSSLPSACAATVAQIAWRDALQRTRCFPARTSPLPSSRRRPRQPRPPSLQKAPNQPSRCRQPRESRAPRHSQSRRRTAQNRGRIPRHRQAEGRSVPRHRQANRSRASCSCAPLHARATAKSRHTANAPRTQPLLPRLRHLQPRVSCSTCATGTGPRPPRAAARSCVGTA